MTRYLEFDLLESIDTSTFQNQKPFPWINPQALIRPEAWLELERDLPGLEDFDERFDEARRAGQTPHDRYSLEYKDGLSIADSWQSFIDELRSDRYRSQICRLFDLKKVEFRFHWHYTPAGCSVSPHIDAVRELGSHIFYFNSPEWQPSWGGQTLILDDRREYPRGSAPDLDAFESVIPADCSGNASLLFQGRDHGWHGVQKIECPKEHLRRVFIVIVNPVSRLWKIRDRLIGKSIQRL
jgi:Rps23 Pro-64 3,4-dihydroxylase Tpa1-like proline 4-hydroxylase